MTVAGCFDAALLGRPAWLGLPDGSRHRLPVDHWRGEPDAADAVLLDGCCGPTLDLGCGPGRLVAELTRRGCSALGVDRSPTAVTLTRRRGAAALRRDAFDRLPGEGRWHTVLLADGNIGIGGDPRRLLDRVRRLLRRSGRLLVETDPPGGSNYQGPARLLDDADQPRCGESRPHRTWADRPGTTDRAVAADRVGGWFSWAWVSADAVPELAARTGFVPGWTREHSGRWFTELTAR